MSGDESRLHEKQGEPSKDDQESTNDEPGLKAWLMVAAIRVGTISSELAIILRSDEDRRRWYMAE